MNDWTWLYHDASAAPIRLDEPAPGFPSQADAETWIGENWRTLVTQGVDAVTLIRDGEAVYGPMSLHPGT